MAADVFADGSRREFLRNTTFAACMAMAGGVELRGQPASAPAVGAAGLECRCAVVGLGPWGRELLTTLGRVQGAKVVAACDRYAGALKRAKTLAPEAELIEDFRSVLARKDVHAVFVATPSHLHSEVAVEALRAGKHVYCEAPLATRIDDARAIGLAARKAAPQLVFQAGLQGRSDPTRLLVSSFFKVGTAGRPVMARTQWHKKASWRHAAATPERTEEINWRLDRSKSLGLAGEIGAHHLDDAAWFFGVRPVAVTGVGAVRHWTEDGRNLADTAQLLVEFPEGLHLTSTLTLASSFEGESEVFFGSDSAILLRDGRAWMFKEADAPLLGWEVHARTEVFRQETGIVLVANASKQKAAADGSNEPPPAPPPPLYHAVEAFVRSVQDVEAAKADFVAAYGMGDGKALAEHLTSVPRRPGAGYQEGFEAAVVAIRAGEAVLAGRRMELKPEEFELGG